MKVIKFNFARICLLAEIVIFFSFYTLGNNGICHFRKLKYEIEKSQHDIMVLKTDIQDLQTTIVVQSEHPFFKEKIAREQLQMGRANEEIYLL